VENSIRGLLCSLGVCDEVSIVPFFSRVRDRDDINVLRCERSGVIFLSRSDHMSSVYYEEKKDLTYWDDEERKVGLAAMLMDDKRRSVAFRDDVAGKFWLDVGTGLGGILDFLSPIAARTLAIEPQIGARVCLQKLGYDVRRDIGDVEMNNIDVVTVFHVLEHFIDPVVTLRRIHERMKDDGRIIIEVPHAKDFLITTLNNEAFKAFTFWSEHLILHTRESLLLFLKEARFHDIVIHGFQRFGLLNHLYWLAKGQPNGHVIWKYLENPEMDKAYSDFLKKIDQTDTLIAVARA